ncbi:MULTISPECIES: nicotinate-nucleotide--dimethylbenzimidazole phosphoribosyltransferase [Acidiplasma]|uniref:UPF0284 protein AOG55_05090 n=2 Tax=Acidiplasma TaxID=507753 RepID=A0A0Q0VWM2_9ARCH|nr:MULTISPECIES: nicotinate-nucleotide--dimethylbenzimidazole phosphoribosyltransferase [Acidiplasma]KPV44724.1 hypothetical protein SE19_08700 [Acidiplasma aeolicum]KQB33610.1 hypothetical protein AOG54_01855 [Acidiplasma aeolicum]KQB36056.1 hypothetical protein AOG55_05090 [Acidiplasma cupricumulans]WMT54481.1 MAG: nicotinate-nucleotide--dimethylbenzimidazole phosphoribosyltransferase [Acidiplasma sp.]
MIIQGNSIINKIDRNDDIIYVLLAGSTEISKIPGISAAGENSELTFLTPVLDSEIIYSGKCISYDVIPMTENGIPTPSIITRAANLVSGVDILIVDAGFYESPKIPYLHTKLGPANDPRKQEALTKYDVAVETGRYIGRMLDKKYKYIVLAESVPGGTTTAYMVLRSLGYDYMTSSSMKSGPDQLKRKVADEAFQRYKPVNNAMDSMIQYGDYMMALATGISGAVRNSTIMYAGGTQMACVYLLDKIINKSHEKRYIFTTGYIINDRGDLLSDIAGGNIIYAKTNFSGIQGLDYYEQGYVKEGTGFGAAFGIAYVINKNENLIYDEIKKVYNSFL